MLTIVKAAEPLRVDRINVCIYGPPGLGKTSMAFTADTPLLLDFDRGSYRAGNRKDTVKITCWKDVTDITAADMTPYHTICVDTAGRALDFLTTDIIAANPKLGYGGALTLQGYGQLKVKFAGWLNMVNALGKDVVLVAHMDEQRKGDDVIERLDVQGGSKGEIYKSVDAMGRIFVQGKQRVIDFSPRENAFGKNPCNLDVMVFPDPLVAPDFLAKLMQQIKDGINRGAQEEKAAVEAMTDWQTALVDCKRADDINVLLPEIKGNVAVKMMVMRRAKELDLTFDRKSNLYVEAQHAAAD